MGCSRHARRVFGLILLFLGHHAYGVVAGPTSGGIHVPIIRKPIAANQRRRSVATGSIGLGDYEDITYNVLIQVGETHIPVVLDTGSSDLWVLSASCQGTCSSNNVSVYPQSSFRPSQLDARLTYGDSNTGTYAQGPIGSDFVSVAGLGLQNQYFAAINSTNTSVAQTGSAGILGLGFPFNSLLWNDLFQNQNQSLNGTSSANGTTPLDVPPERRGANARFPHRLKNLVSRWFRKTGRVSDERAPLTRSMPPSTTTTALLASIINYGPLIPRLVAQHALDSPMFSITLQRDSIEIGGNEGILSIGQLPPSVRSESLTWVGVRGYPPSQGGMDPPSDAHGETYPLTWEIPLDDVWLDGIRLDRSKQSSSYISLSALIDTGNSLIRGPPDVVAQIISLIGGPQFSCATPHNLEFEIGGKLFPVDPRDLVSEAHPGDPDICSANIAATDVPVLGGSGYLYSWNLGDPFLKGVLVAFDYGSLARPSQNPPRVGLLSTVESDAGKRLCDDQRRAALRHEGYPVIVEPAPSLLPSARGTGIGGVPLAPVPTVSHNGGIQGLLSESMSGFSGICVCIWIGTVMGWMVWMT